MKSAVKSKWIACALVVMILLAAAGCGGELPVDEDLAVDAYLLVIDKLYVEDPGLNNDITYLAIDTENMINLTETGKERLLTELEKYGHEVLNATFEELEEQGLIEDLHFPDGILFRIKDTPMEDNTITMDASKWRSGTGAYGYDGTELKYENEMWEIKDIGSGWIS